MVHPFNTAWDEKHCSLSHDVSNDSVFLVVPVLLFP